MEQAKQAVSSFLHRDGKSHTEVDESVAPAVTSETVKPHRHEETTEAVDREVHQHHYHTTVQPIEHKEILPEQHKHNLMPTVEQTVHHGSEEQDQSKVAAEMGQFKDASRTVETTHSTSAAPAVTGEHVHHHVHETVQPVIHKETVQPEVVHTTIPIHEKHIAPSEHHGLSTLPVKTMDEFKQMGTSLTGGTTSHHEYEGHPRPYNPAMQAKQAPADVDPPAHRGTHDPEKTGHFADLNTGAGSSTTGTAGQHVHESADVRHGTGAAAGTAAAGTVAGAGAGAALASHGHQDTQNREPVSSTSGATHRGHARKTSKGYYTTADEKPSYGKTAFGMLTGSGNRHGPQDGSATSGHGTGAAAGTAAAGAAGATAASASRDTPTDSPAEQRGSTREAETEPSNIKNESSKADPTSEYDGPAIDDDNIQHASRMGEDPSLIADPKLKDGKLTGTGEDGSHSAVFGLTPDGHKFDDTKSKAAEIAHSHSGEIEDTKEEKSGGDGGVGKEKAEEPDEPGKEGVAGQMNKPRVAEPEHEGKAEYQPGDTTKPGAGVST